MSTINQHYRKLATYGTIVLVLSMVCLMAYKLIFRMGKFDEASVKPGQFYKLTLYNEDPFQEDVSIFFKVLDVKDGYVQFVNLESRDTSSETLRFFIKSVELAKEAELPTR
jgi:hypothetical protein